MSDFEANVLGVEAEKDEHGKPWYNVRLSVSICGRRSVVGVVSLGADLKAQGDSAQAWISRSLLSEMAHLSGPKFSDVAKRLDTVAADAVREQAGSRARKRSRSRT